MTQTRTSRLLLVFLLVFSCFFMSAKPAQASILDWLGGIFKTESTTKSVNSFKSINADKEKFDAESISNILTNINLHSVGMAAIPNDGAQSTSERKALEKELGYGVLGDINSGIVALYNPPASTRTYVADVMKSAKIIPEAQAQGLGFSALDPILETWKSFRNLAYLFFVVIFLIIGFMIMFRTKVGQAAITAQQAIPSVIVAMLAVTFSYAIAGFMIDIMYVAMYVLASYFTEGSKIISGNIFSLVGLMFQGTGAATQNAIEQFMESALNISMVNYVGQAVSWLSSLMGTVIIGIAILFATFKVFFELVKTYVSVLIQIIFSPIILMLGAFPGKNTFGKWLKNLAGNLILWPVVLLCVLVQRMLTAPIRSLNWSGNEALIDSTFGGGFMPPFLIGQGQGNIIPVILGIGILLVIPEIMQQVKKTMGVEEGIFGQLAGDAWKRVKEASNPGMKIAGAGASLGLGAAGALGGGALGFASGGGSIEERMAKAKDWAGKGALGGALAPTIVTKAPKFIKGMTEFTVRQAEQGMVTRAGEYIQQKARGSAAEKVVGQVTGLIGSQKGGKNQSNYSPEENENVTG